MNLFLGYCILHLVQRAFTNGTDSSDGVVPNWLPEEEMGVSFWGTEVRRVFLGGGADKGSGLRFWGLGSLSFLGSEIGWVDVLRGDTETGLKLGFFRRSPSIARITSSMWAILADLFLDLILFLKAILYLLQKRRFPLTIALWSNILSAWIARFFIQASLGPDFLELVRKDRKGSLTGSVSIDVGLFDVEG